MALIKVDPSQNKIAAALTAVLIGAMAVTALRMRAPATISAPAQARETASACGSLQKTAQIERRPDHNPFRRPASLRTVASEVGVPAEDAMARPAPAPLLPAAPEFGIRNPESGMRNPEHVRSAKPTFTLLATIRSAEHLYGIIKSGDSRERIVRVGDILDGGYKVKELDASHAVLTNGRDTLIAERPDLQQSHAEMANGG